MGVFDFATNVISRYKADIRDHKRKIRELSGEQRKMAKAQLKSLEVQNAKLDTSIAAVGKLAAGIAGVAVAYHGLNKAVDAYAEDASLRFSAQKFDIDALKKATGGLISEIDLLKLAAGAANTDFEISQTQLENTAKAMLSLRKQSNDFREVIDLTTKAIVEGEVEGMKKFGVILETTGTKVDKHRDLMSRLGQEAQKFGGNFTMAGDDIKRAQVSMADSFRRLGVQLGKLANALAPVIEMMADFLESLPRFGESLVSGGDDARDVERLIAQRRKITSGMPVSALSLGSQQIVKQLDSEIRATMQAYSLRFFGGGAQGGKRARQFQALMDRGDFVAAMALIGARGRDATSAAATAPLEFAADEITDADVKHARERAKRAAANRPDVLFEHPELRDIVRNNLGIEFSGLPRGRTFGGQETGIGRVLNRARAPDGNIASETAKAMETIDATIATLRLRENETLLRRVFGTPEEFDAIATGLGMLRDVATSAFGAWVDGSKSASEAVKAAFTEGLKGLAMEMFSRALFHGAMAIGALAIGGPIAGASAAKHAQAAAAFGAGAATIGTVARQLGGSGAAGVGARAGAGGAVQSRHVSNTFFLGDSFIDESPRRRAAKLGRAMRRSKEVRGDVREVVEF